MSIESLAAIGGSTPALGTPAVATPVFGASALERTSEAITPTGSPPHGAFESMLSAVSELNQELQTGERGLQQVAVGGGLDNLHQSLLGMERTRLTLQLLLQVRSRALDAYQELTRMQI